MQTADDIINVRLQGASLDDIQAALSAKVPIASAAYREIVKEAACAIDEALANIKGSLDRQDLSVLYEIARKIKDVAVTLEDVYSAIYSSNGK